MELRRKKSKEKVSEVPILEENVKKVIIEEEIVEFFEIQKIEYIVVEKGQSNVYKNHHSGSPNGVISVSLSIVQSLE